MTRLVDADELKHDLEWLECDTPVYLDVMSTIDERTTVDAVEVVRCKDCLNSWVIPKEMRNVGEYRCEFWYAEMYGDDYCSYGERREDETD